MDYEVDKAVAQAERMHFRRQLAVPGELPIKLRLEALLALGSGVANDNR